MAPRIHSVLGKSFAEDGVFVLGSKFALWTCRPAIACERGSVGSVGSMGSKGKVRRIKIRSAAEYKKGDAPK